MLLCGASSGSSKAQSSRSTTCPLVLAQVRSLGAVRLPSLCLLKLSQHPRTLRERTLQRVVGVRAGQAARRVGAAAAGAAAGAVAAGLPLLLLLLPELVQVVDGGQEALAVAQWSDADLELRQGRARGCMLSFRGMQSQAGGSYMG